MKRMLSLVLSLLLVFSLTASALAEDRYLIAGYDNADSNHDWATHPFFQQMEKLTGVALDVEQYTTKEAWEEAKPLLLNGSKNMPDALFKAALTTAETEAYYASGALIDLKPYLSEYAPNLSALLAAHPDWEKAITLPGGAIVALPTINEIQNNNAAWINTNWLKNVGLSMPTTVEELTEVLRAFKTKDPNRNGRNDETPLVFTSLWDLRYLAQAFGLISNDYHVRVTDGKVVCTADSDENYAFLSWLHQLWEEGLLDPNGFSSTDTMRAVTDSDATITYGIVFGPTSMSMLPSSVTGSYSVLMPLSVDGEAGKWRAFQSPVVRGTFAITSACEHPEVLVAWVDTLYSSVGERLAQAGVEEEDYFFNADGTWEYIANDETIANTGLADRIITGGGNMPGLVTAEFQLLFNDDATHRTIAQLHELSLVSEYPFPLIWLSDSDTKTIEDIWNDLGPAMELTMVHFVTGDLPLNETTWADFTASIHNGGMDTLISIWQKAIDQ